MQMICALLVFQSPDLPEPLASLSPWLDWLGAPRDEVYGQLAAQQHRRFIKTHTPLDGIPLDARATYVVVARHPLADRLVPSIVLMSNAAFFRRGTSGSGREVLTDGELSHYRERAAHMAPPDLLSWLHHPHGKSSLPR
jgi:Sulfotransferase domain